MLQLLKIILFVVLVECIASLALAGSIFLEGVHKFHPGDDLRWADYSFDDSEWQKIEVPGSWQSQNLIPMEGKGWIRIGFSLPGDFPIQDLGVLLGNIGNIDETFLNGIKIGGSGKFGNWFVDASYIERLYRIPADLLKTDGENVLSVRILGFYRHSGILNSPVVIDDYNTLLIGKLQREFEKKVQEVVFIFTVCLVFLACYFFYFQGTQKAELVYFWRMISAILVTYTIETGIFYDTGWKNVVLQNVSLFCYAMVAPSFLMFVLIGLKIKVNNAFQLIYICGIGLALLLGCFGTYNFVVYSWLSYLWLIYLIFVAGALLYASFRVYREKLEGSAPILAGIVLLIVTAVIEIMELVINTPYKNIYLSQYLILLFVIIILYAFIQRFLQIKRRTEILSSRILHSYEEERKRLSRELHDGLGQSFLSMKLNLQRINADLKNRLVDETIEDISDGINQLRDISQGLHPPLLKKAGLATTLESYCGKYSDKSGIKTVVKTDYPVRQPLHIEENMFRIFQEAVSNIAKHAKADMVKLFLFTSRHTLILEISDDGVGFSFQDAFSSSEGQGLRTIKERVDLMDGKLNYTRHNGTTIRVEVPLK